jgi:Polyketide cyclase / dehydrase and lipid transport
VWELAGDPARLHEWFPGISACVVDGSTRIITLGSGLPLPEEILVIDGLQRRFQYRITAPIFRHHRGTIDVIELDAASCLVVYATEADPRTMALTIGGGTADALDELKRQMEVD